MIKWIKKFWFLLLLIFIVSCAPTTKRATLDTDAVQLEAEKQKEIALESLVNKQKRLLKVGHPILSSATALCEEKVKASTGAWFANKHVFPKDFKEAATNRLQLGDELEVFYIIPDSPADAAGLITGDVLIGVNNEDMPTGKNAVEKMQKIFDEQLAAGNVATLRFTRNGSEYSTDITPVKICDYPVVLDESDSVNAFADGKKIAITKGMIRFTETDHELALVISHELAHNAMGHINAKMGNYALGSIFDVLAAAYGVDTQGTFGKMASNAYSQEFEAEADYVGLYIMAMAGLEIDDAASFWRRMAAEHPSSIKSNYAASHPSTPERFVGLEQTEDEINAKKTANLPLVPEYKD